MVGYRRFNSERKASKIKMWNGIIIQAYPANESVRGEENVICVFMSECAFINLLDDSKVYNAITQTLRILAMQTLSWSQPLMERGVSFGSSSLIRVMSTIN